MMNEKSVFSVCPLLLPQNINRTCYEGFITVSGKDYHIKITLPPDKSMKNARIEGDWKLKHALREHADLIQQRLQQSSDLPTFLAELTSLLEQVEKSQPNDYLKVLATPTYYTGLLQQLERIGWNRVIDIDSALSKIQLKGEDSSGRSHIITVHLNPKNSELECSADLPRPLTMKGQTQDHLETVFSQFLSALTPYQDFWLIMDELDQAVWILDPDKPKRSDTSRRIALGGSASLQINVDPIHPRMPPEFRFMGADHVISPLKEKLNSGLANWEAELGLLKNLKNILKIEFPSKVASKQQDYNMECGICYAYKLESAVPDKVCDDSRCGQPFHQSCLYEWLRALPSSRQSFNTIFGECPYCNSPITLKMEMK